MSAREATSRARALLAFRRRVDALFGDPQAAAYVVGRPAADAAPPTTSEDVLASRLDDVLTRLGAPTAGGALTLRKSLTMHDGRVVSMVGDTKPLGADDDVRIVTTTTTVLDAERLRVETTVLVFERADRP